MRVLEIDSKSQYINAIKDIYLYSFPEYERIDFNEIINLKFPNSKILAFLNNEALIGFSFVSTSLNFAYIVYLAIDKEQRNKNYGSLALKKIDNLYKNKTKVLCVEKPNSKEDMKSRRIGFYKKNGFMLANFEFEWFGQKYYSMYKGSFNKQKFIDFLLVCFPGCTNFKDIE